MDRHFGNFSFFVAQEVRFKQDIGNRICLGYYWRFFLVFHVSFLGACFSHKNMLSYIQLVFNVSYPQGVPPICIFQLGGHPNSKLQDKPAIIMRSYNRIIIAEISSPKGGLVDIATLQNVVRRFPELEAAIKSKTGSPVREMAGSIDFIQVESLSSREQLEKLAAAENLPLSERGRVVKCSESLRYIQIFCAD